MRILHVLDHSLPLHSGYTFRTRAIMKAQIARGWDVAGVTGTRQEDGAPPAVIDGLRFFRTEAAVGGPAGLREWREVRAFARAIEAAIDSYRPDILHAHSPVLGALAALRPARRRRLPLVYEIRAFWEDAAVGNLTGREGSSRYRLTKAVETWAARRVDAITVICEGLRADLVARGIAADSITVVPNGVDLRLFGDPPPPDEALRRSLGLQGKNVVGFIGSFYDYEGIDDLIAAIDLMPDMNLLLVGGGPMEDALRRQSAGSDRIHFVGRVPHDEVERYYGLIDVLAYPRKSMRLTEIVTPLKPLEAMAQGRLVAASNVGGHRELIEDGVTGTLFAPGDSRAIAEALRAMFADRAMWPERRAAARAFVERDRNWAFNISRYEPVYRKLLGR